MNVANSRTPLGTARRGRTRHRTFQIGYLLATLSVSPVPMACRSDPRPSTVAFHTSGGQSSGSSSCHAGLQGCPCDFAGDQHTCGEVTTRDGDFVTCSEGLSTCTNGVWGPCVGDHLVQRSTQSITLNQASGLHLSSVESACADVCDPYCSNISSDVSDGADAGGIAVAPDGGLTLSSTPSAPGSGTNCTGLQCSIALCGGNAAATKLTGTVYDPAGKMPLYNAYVYVPVNSDLTQLPVFSDSWTNGVSCDRCADTTVRAVAVAQTSTNGSFTLESVPSGSNIPLVVQMGKWRRIILLSTITDCQTNTVTNNCTATDKSLCAVRLPRNRFDGYNPANGSYTYVSATGANGKADMPQIAMISGAADPFECMLLKAGLDPNEFGSYDTHPERQIHYYHSPDRPGSKLSTTYGNQISGDVLWNSATNLAKYDVVIPACEGDSIDKLQSVNRPPAGVNPYRNLIDYTNLGGRVFTTHYGYVWLQYPYVKSGYGDWRSVASWTHQTSTTTTQDPLAATLVTSFPKGSAFSQWLVSTSSTITSGQLTIHEGRQDLTTIDTSAQGWMTATNSMNSSSAFTPLFTFNTPYGVADAGQCGRVVFSDFHVSANALVNTSSTSCYTAADCGFTATCTGGSAPTLGTCSEPCATDSDCSPGYTCGGTIVAGSCTPLACTNTCSGGGVCSSNKCTCTSGGQCGSDSCTLTPGTCASAACTTDANCGPSEYCSGALRGTCTVDSCSQGNQCASGSCVNGHCACTTGTQCSSQSCSATPPVCGAASCDSDHTTCGASETCTLGTSGVCVGDPCSRGSNCSTNQCNGDSSTCGCKSDSNCGSGRKCTTSGSRNHPLGYCSSKACTSDSNCQTWEHCQFAGTCNPAPCSSGRCSAGTCQSDGKCHCSHNWDCASNSCVASKGACSGTAASCWQDSECGNIESCTGTATGTCAARSCSTSNPCPAGSCVSGICKCTSAGNCASNSCSGVGTCAAKACFSNAACGVTEQCTGATTGTCTKACNVSGDCSNGETCTSGKCTGCTSSTQCKTAMYGASCTGSSGGVRGTCSLNSATIFPQACHQGDLTAQERALEFMFFDLTACVTPDSYQPQGPTVLYSTASFNPPDYVASCDRDSAPRWRQLQWRAYIPAPASSAIAPASITFAAQTGDPGAAGAAGAPTYSLLPAAPLTIATTTASTATSSTDVAYIDTCTTDTDSGTTCTGAFNQASPPVFSGSILRLTITLSPSSDNLTAPRLLDWSVVYDCVPAK